MFVTCETLRSIEREIFLSGRVALLPEDMVPNGELQHDSVAYTTGYSKIIF